MEDITVENANDMMAKAKISNTTYTKQAAAWVIINQFCHQSGLFHNREDDDLSGIQRVIKYLSETQAEIKALREEIERLKAEQKGIAPRMVRCSSTGCTWPNCYCSKL